MYTVYTNSYGLNFVNIERIAVVLGQTLVSVLIIGDSDSNKLAALTCFTIATLT